MPEPDRQPPQPRPISTARWLLLLTPSLPMLVAPLIAQAWVRANHERSETAMSRLFWVFLVAFPISAVLSIILGVQKEKWQHGRIESRARAFANGQGILFTACFIAYGGCAVAERVSH